MNYDKAIKILKIENYSPLNYNIIKKQYHKMALKYHPDKNKDRHSKEYFHLIRESYEYLTLFYKNNGEYNEENNNINIESREGEENDNSYFNNLRKFISTVLDNLNLQETDELTEIIISGFKNISLKIFDKMKINTIISIYTFLHKYKDLLLLDDQILNSILNNIIIKLSHCENIYPSFYILNPSLKDLLNDNIYKLIIDDITYCVPLWCNEVVFDKTQKINNSNITNENDEIIVKCIPEITEKNITIDKDNNLFINYEITEEQLLKSETIDICIYEKIFKIPTSEIINEKINKYVFKNAGILKEDLQYHFDDIHDIQYNTLFNISINNNTKEIYRGDVICMLSYI